MKSDTIYERMYYSIIFVVVLILFLFTSQSLPIFAQKSNVVNTGAISHDTSNYKVTFIELGSVKCIPCKEMQPVMHSIEKKIWQPGESCFL
jgi:thioredoxin 1